MKKKLLSLALGLCMVLTLMPTVALAAVDTIDVYVGNTNVVGGGYWRVDGSESPTNFLTQTDANEDNYVVHYNVTTHTLTLKDITVSDTAHMGAAISVYGNITLELVGTNSVTGPSSVGESCGICVNNGNLTIQGSGSLTATGGATSVRCSIGVKETSGNFSIESGTVTAVGGQTSDNDSSSSGVYVMGAISNNTGSISVSGTGRLTGTSNQAGGYGCGVFVENSIDVSGSGYIEGIGGAITRTSATSYGINARNSITVSGGTLKGTGGEATSSYGVAVESGEITINGGSFTANSTSTTGTTVQALQEAPTLGSGVTLYAGLFGNGSSLGTYSSGSFASYKYVTTEAPTVSATPTATITSVAKASATQTTVNFTLTNAPAFNDGQTWKVYASADGNTPVTGVTATNTGNTLTLHHATNVPAGIYYVSVTETGQAESSRLALTVTVPNAPTTVYVGNTDVVGGGYWLKNTSGTANLTKTGAVANNYHVHYNAATATLTLNNVSMTAGMSENHCGIYANGNLTIMLNGTNSVTGPANSSGNSLGIQVGNNNLTVSGNGSLTVAGGNADGSASATSIGVHANNITIYSGTLSATGGTAAGNSYGVNCTSVEVSGGTLIATGGTASSSSGSSAGVYVISSCEVNSDGNLTATGGETDWNSYGVYVYNGSVIITDSTATATGGNATNGSSFGTFLENNSVTITDSTVTAAGGEATNGISRAFNKQPTFGETNWYQWRIENAGEYTQSATTPYTWESTQTYVEIKPDTTPSNPGGSGGGGGSSTPSTYTVPVEGGGSSVNASATVSGGIATVTTNNTQLNTVLNDENTSGNIAINAELGKKVDAVSIPTTAVESISEAAQDGEKAITGLDVKTDTGTVSFDEAALAALAEQAVGSTVTIRVEEITTSGLNSTQREAMTGNYADAQIIEVTATSGGVKITNYNGGEITVTVPYTLKDGESADGIRVWHLASDGTLTLMQCSYDASAKTVSFVTDHLSDFIIDYDVTATLVNPFSDIASGAYYYNAVLWAVNEGVTGGTTATTFAPNATCTRAQAVTFLWRAMGEPEPTTTVNPFADVSANAYYYKAVLWAVEKGVTDGTSTTTFSPNATCSRGQIVTFLWRAAGKSAVTAANPFSDVTNGAYYENAVLWAVSKGITDGTTAATFSPANGCTRAQIVTFLYRYLGQ